MANVKITQAQLDSVVTAINNRAKTSDMTTALAGKQDTLTAGTNVTISNGVISANDTSIQFNEITGKPTTLSGYGITDGQQALVSGTNIKSINGTSILGSGDVVINAGGVSLSGITAYHLLEGSLSLSNTEIRTGFSTTLYTGNGTTQSINTGVDMATQWGNDASETFGGLVWLKSRGIVASNSLFDTIRGATNKIFTDLTNAQSPLASSLTSFGSSIFSLGSDSGVNANAATYASWTHQTTHRITGTTNHGKAYTCHYNPYTGFTMVKYEGSGIAGHEIPHHLGRKLGFVTVKNLSAVTNWTVFSNNNYLQLNTNIAGSSVQEISNETSYILSPTNADYNASTQQHILYGWANSYYDEANTLIGNYEVGVYQGTGAAGNKVKTRGKPAWVMVKRLDSTAGWVIMDVLRGSFDNYLLANLSNAEDSNGHYDLITPAADGFSFVTTDPSYNAAGGQYLYMVVYDNDSGSGKSKYPKALDNAVLNLTAKVPFANGVDASGTKVSILSKNETVSGVTLSQGKNYVYAKNDGTFGVSKFSPNYNQYSGFGDYFDVNTNKWYQSPSVFADDCSSTTNWTAQTGATISNLNGKLKVSATTGDYATATTVVNGLVVGKKYRIKMDSNNTVDSQFDSCRIFAGTTQYTGVSAIGQTVGREYATLFLSFYGADFIATQSTLYISASNYQITDNSYSLFDNIAVYPINNDGSVDISNATPITESRNYLNAVVYADQNGQPTYVEQLPKTQYVDEIKANEFKGKNACTAWALVDATTTPPSLINSYNVSSVIRTATGNYDVYTQMDNSLYSVVGLADNGDAGSSNLVIHTDYTKPKTSNKFSLVSELSTGTNQNCIFSILLFGGKN